MPCFVCDENARHLDGTAQGVVGETSTGFVRLHSRQRYVGATFFVAKLCVREIYHLKPSIRRRHFEELAGITESLDEVFSPHKLNVESLGNSVPHLHWWLTPRYVSDPLPGSPIWEDSQFVADMKNDEGHAPLDVLEFRANNLRTALLHRNLLIH